MQRLLATHSKHEHKLRNLNNRNHNKESYKCWKMITNDLGMMS